MAGVFPSLDSIRNYFTENDANTRVWSSGQAKAWGGKEKFVLGFIYTTILEIIPGGYEKKDKKNKRFQLGYAYGWLGIIVITKYLLRDWARRPSYIPGRDIRIQ